MLQLEDFTNFDLLSVGVAIAASILLGFVVYVNNRKSITSQMFLLFTFVSAFWGGFNYFLYQFSDPQVSLWFIRLVMFCAIWQAFSFYLLAHVYPESDKHLGQKIKRYLFPTVILVSILTLTPLLYSRIITSNGPDQIVQAQTAPGILAFGILAVGLVVASIVNLMRRRAKSSGVTKKQYNLFLTGTSLMFGLIITCNFIIPNTLQYYSYIPYGALFTFPFLALTAYAILRHHLFNTKIIATEIIAFFLLVLSFVEVVISRTQLEVLFRVVVFLILLVVSILLLRSVRREVQQREELQVLTEKLEKANEKLRALDKARADFITMASHQLRTPPATMKWYLAALLGGDFGELSKDVREALEKAQLSNNSLISLIDDMLNVSRIERGKIEFVFEKVNIFDLVKMTVDQLMPLARIKNLQLGYRPPKNHVPEVMADREKVRQVINNLIDNAIKYTKEGHVLVTADCENGNVIVKVTDTGKGVEKEEAQNLFQKFGRGKDSGNFATGLGLGLYLAKVVVEEHNGRIWVESPGIGKGSTFMFTLPVKSQLKSPSALVDLTKQQGK